MSGLPELYDNKMNYRYPGAGAAYYNQGMISSGGIAPPSGYFNKANQPPNRTAIIFIDSRDKTNPYDTAADFEVDLTVNLPNIKIIQPIYAFIPIAFSPFQDGVLRWIIEGVNGNDKALISMSINDKVYLQADGFAELEKDMQDATLSTINETVVFTITTLSNNKIEFKTDKGNLYFMPRYQEGYMVPNTEQSAAINQDIPEFNATSSHNFGFKYENKSGAAIIGEKKITSDYVSSLQGETYINIYCNVDLNSSHTNASRDRKNVLCQVPVTDYGTAIQVNKLNFTTMNVDINNLKRLSFVLEFPDGTKPKLDPNQHIGLQLKVWYYEPSKGASTAH